MSHDASDVDTLAARIRHRLRLTAGDYGLPCVHISPAWGLVPL
jgi:hypothetical protein